MDNRLKEVLSAMLDDEADEFSIQRVMRKAESKQLQMQWHRWQQARALMHDDERPYAQIDVTSAVWQRLEGHEAPPRAPMLRRTVSSIRRSSPWAAAAMIILAMGVGFGAGFQWHGGGGVNGDGDASTPAVAHDGFASDGRAMVAQADGQAQVDGQAGGVPNIVLSKLDQAQRNQLSVYLLRHAQHNSFGSGRSAVGFARVASISYQQ